MEKFYSRSESFKRKFSMDALKRREVKKRTKALNKKIKKSEFKFNCVGTTGVIGLRTTGPQRVI